jgi:hypothetical protein
MYFLLFSDMQRALHCANSCQVYVRKNQGGGQQFDMYEYLEIALVIT